MFICQIFKKQGFDLVPHPIVKGTSKRPDFLAVKNDFEFYIEVKEANYVTESEVASSKRESAILDAINRLIISDFWLVIKELTIKSAAQPSGKSIARAIKLKIEEFASGCLPMPMNSKENDELGSVIGDIVIDNDDVRVVIDLLPQSKKAIKGEGSIGVYPMQTFWGGPEDSIRTSIRKKATRYGELDKPYLICINALSTKGVSREGVEFALLGSPTVIYSADPGACEGKWKFEKDGVFLSARGPQLTRESGVLVTNVFPSNIHVAPHWFYKHPFARNELYFSEFDLSYHHLVGSY
ncbi:hypothetical protein [Solirubrum puertoriconensis]|uniref:hypothetical protein n=1 Tax=Solirubrum puertoriconensis TaxID=1751427 RepID=UPI00122E8AA4|nr:hypothetical protein [Solirubrum puertoriconensis]